ncbi:tetratricopeptide repeat protein [Phocaeicola sp.]
MKTLVTLLLCIFSISTFAQTNDEIRQAMDEYDYEKVINLIGPGNQDSLLVSVRAQALKAMNRYPEAVKELNSLILKDSTNTKNLVELAECYKLMGNSRQAANCYQKAVNVRPENKFFRLQNIRALLASADYEDAKKACHGWLEQDTCSATGFKYLGQAYEGMEDITSAFLSYNAAYRRDSLDYQTVARIAGIFNNNQQYPDAVMVTERYRLTDTTSVDVNRQNAKAYCMMGDYQSAISRYEALKTLGDRSFTTYYYLGISYFADNWFYGAYDNLNEAYRQNPQDINVLYYFARSCSRTSWKKEGAELMEEALKLAVPTDSLMTRLYKGMVECYGYAGDTYKKIEAMQNLYKLNKDYTIFYSIARDYDWKKDYQNAVYFYEKYMSLTPKSGREPVYDEEGNLVKDAVTRYQLAERRVKKIKEEDFFRNGAPDDEFFRFQKVEKKDTVAQR